MRNSNCKDCKLYVGTKTVCMWGEGPLNADVMIIGRSPDTTDDLMGKPFTSKDGAMLETLLEESNLKRSDVYITHLVKCNSPGAPTREEKDVCVKYLKEEIKTVNPKVIVTLGSDPLEALTGHDKVMKMAGTPINVKSDTTWEWEGVVYPTVNPGYLENNPVYMTRVKKHFRDIGYYAKGIEPPKANTNYAYLTDFSRIDKFFDQLEQQKLVAYDTETSSLNFLKGKLLCFSFSWKEKTAVVLPLLGFKCEKIWTDEQYNHILGRLKQVFAIPTIEWIAHNMSFDHKYVLEYGNRYDACKGMDIVGPLHDTMLLQHLIDENELDMKGLKALANIHTDMGRYDDPLDEFKDQLKAEKSKLKTESKSEIVKKIKMVQSMIDSNPDDELAIEDLSELQNELVSLEETSIDISYDEIPTDILWPYAAMDADATFRIFKHHYALLQKESKKYETVSPQARAGLTLHRLYVNLVMKLRRVLDEMEFYGAYMDRDRLKELDKIYQARIDVLTEEFIALPEVATVERILLHNAQKKAEEKYKKLKSVIDYNEYKDTLAAGNLWDPDKKIPKAPKFKCKEDYGRHYGKAVKFNMNSPTHLRILIYDAFLVSKRNAKETKQGSGVLSTDHEVLELNSDKPGVDLLLENRKLTKLHNTYVKGSLAILNENGTNRIHTSFNQHVTVTGRLSSSKPNLQNIPREDKDIKGAFKCEDPDWRILQMDYSQAEFRMWCQLSGDGAMAKDIHAGVDIHIQTASDFWGIPYAQLKADLESDDPTIKKAAKHRRSSAKFVVFGLMYGRGAASVAKQVGITTDEAETIKNIFFARYPVAARWLDLIKKNAETVGYIPGHFGRIRRLPNGKSKDREKQAEAKRQAVNSPIQGSAADMTGIALIRIRQRLIDSGLNEWARLILTVHDSIILEVHKSKVKEVAELCIEAMTEKLPLMNIQMGADVEVGETWASVDSYREEDWESGYAGSSVR